ncbi:MAG: UPF0182 family protein [Gemmatimonadetes bacterium]|nr:UPF0182 family protein [Gemmatimonadota bacterium]
MTGRRGLLWLVAGLALTLLFGRWVAGLYGDWAFHHALGADALWRERVALTALMRVGTFALVFGFAFANLFAVRQSIVALVLPRVVGGVEFGEAIPTRRLTLLALAVSVLLAVLFALTEQDWTLLGQAIHGVPFVEFDPYLDRDLGFYVHWLPFERYLAQLVAVLVAVTAAVVVASYVVTPSVRWDAQGLYVSTWVRRHLGILGAVGIACIAWEWRLDKFALLMAGTGDSMFAMEVPTFSPFDHRVMMPYLTVLSFVAVPLAVVFALAVWRGHLRIAVGLLTALFVFGPLARVLLPTMLWTLSEERRSAAALRPYARTRMLFTRRAYGVDQVAWPDTMPLAPLSEAEAARWVSTWDPAALTRSLERERRGEDVVALSWTMGESGLEAQLLRRAPSDALPGTRWPSDRLRADAADVSGYPVPGEAGVAGIDGVLVHPGAPRYALVADTLGRLAAPSYEHPIERLLLAWDQQNPRLLTAEAPQPRPRLLTERDAMARVARLTPFLGQGERVTPLVRGDSLFWVVELFATAEEYPLSERLLVDGGAVHYAQHAATAVVQAQTGAVLLLPVERPDPVMRTWMSRFPTLFTPRERAPRWMANALPPAVDWALVQGALIGRTGVNGDTLPVSQLARIDDADPDLATGPPTFFVLDSLGTPGWGVPVANAQRLVGVPDSDRLVGLLVARGGLWPRTTMLEPGVGLNWKELLEDLQEAADGAGVGRGLKDARRGRVQAIPTAKGALFVQSFYEWPQDGPPRLAGVVTIRGSQVRVGRTLAEALGQANAGAGAVRSPEAFRAQAGKLYDAMGAALRAGDWKAYGEAWAGLGRLLGRPPR